MWSSGIAWWTAKRPIIIFALKWGGLLALFYALLAIPAVEKLLYYYLAANAWLSSFILNLFGEGTQVADVTIRSPQFAIAIRRGCDAIEPAWLLAAAILAVPSSWRNRLLGILAGFVILQLLNLLRIVTLFWIGLRFPQVFSFAHLEAWPSIFILASISLFLSWKGWARET